MEFSFGAYDMNLQAMTANFSDGAYDAISRRVAIDDISILIPNIANKAVNELRLG